MMYRGDIFVVTQRVEVCNIYNNNLQSLFFLIVPLLHQIGDLYGGSHYSQLCSADMTPQGRAIQDAATKFGDGKTLPFTPCKKGYTPYHKSTGERLYACMHHNKARRRRLVKNNAIIPRSGEVDLNIFENNDNENPV